jgi:hypothetical protein
VLTNQVLIPDDFFLQLGCRSCPVLSRSDATFNNLFERGFAKHEEILVDKFVTSNPGRTLRQFVLVVRGLGKHYVSTFQREQETFHVCEMDIVSKFVIHDE